MVLKGVNHRIEVVHSQLLYLIKPPGQFQSCSIFDAPGIIDIGKFHSQLISFLELRVVFKDDFRPEFLRFRPFGLVLGQYELSSGKQLFPCISIAVPERPIDPVLLPSPPYLLIFPVPCHPSVGYAHVVQSVIVEFLHMKSVTCDESLGEHRAHNHHHRGRQVECYLLNYIPFGKFNLFQDMDYALSSGSSDHSHQRTPAAPASLVGQKSIDLAAAQAGLVDTQALS